MFCKIFLIVAVAVTVSTAQFVGCTKGLNPVHFGTRCNGDVAYLPFAGGFELQAGATDKQLMHNSAFETTDTVQFDVLGQDDLSVSISDQDGDTYQDGTYTLLLHNPTEDPITLDSGAIFAILQNKICNQGGGGE